MICEAATERGGARHWAKIQSGSPKLFGRGSWIFGDADRKREAKKYTMIWIDFELQDSFLNVGGGYEPTRPEFEQYLDNKGDQGRTSE